MLIKESNAFRVVRATLHKGTPISRPLYKFILHILELWLSMNCRYVFTSFERWGSRTEQSYRRMFSKTIDWMGFNTALIHQHCSKELICVFDPTYLKKSGKQTYGLGKFWSGAASRALKGLEVGVLGFVDVAGQTALHALAVQTPCPGGLKAAGKTLIDHYRGIIGEHLACIKALSPYLVVDGYFFKREFIAPLLVEELQVITKGRRDCNLRYLYKGPRHKGKGRPRLYEGKVDTTAIDKRKIRGVYSDEEKTIYAAPLYAVQLKRKVMVAFVYFKEKETPEILISTDPTQDPIQMCRYYGLRFQVEFLIRDAKQYAGLQDCQARSKEKLHNHFNIALSVVSVAKAAHYLHLPMQKRGSFSMADIKMKYMNQLITDRIFSNLDLDFSLKKIKHLYQQCLNFGRLRA